MNHCVAKSVGGMAIATGVAWSLFAASAVSLTLTRRCLGQTKLDASRSIDFAGGKVVAGCRPGEVKLRPDLLVHFHGDARVVAERFAQSDVDAVLVVVNFHGLSSAYKQPFVASPKLFDELLDLALQAVREMKGLEADLQWNTICLSSFSAGYGSVREILKNPDYFQRIEGILAADSIYAGLQGGGDQRAVNQDQMRDFLRFARRASVGEKTFVLTHSYLNTSYASTEETADYLLRSLSIKREALTPAEGNAMQPISRAEQGGFLVLGFEGATGEAHMQHLRQIQHAWRTLPLRSLSADSAQNE